VANLECTGEGLDGDDDDAFSSVASSFSSSNGTKVQFFWDGWEDDVFVGPPWQGRARLDLTNVCSMDELREEVAARAEQMFGAGSLPPERVDLSYRLPKSKRSGGKSKGAKALLPLLSLQAARSSGVIFVTRGELVDADATFAGGPSGGRRLIRPQPQPLPPAQPALLRDFSDSQWREPTDNKHPPPRQGKPQPVGGGRRIDFVVQWGERRDVIFNAPLADIPTVEAAFRFAMEKIGQLTGGEVRRSSVRMMCLQPSGVTGRLHLAPVTRMAPLACGKAAEYA